MTATATEWCNDCKNRYCAECSKTVHGLPAFKSHRIIQGSTGSSMILACDKHPDEKLKYWCKSVTCETVTCRDCLLFEHKDHEYVPMDAVVHDVKATVRTWTSLQREFDLCGLFRLKAIYKLFNVI